MDLSGVLAHRRRLRAQGPAGMLDAALAEPGPGALAALAGLDPEELDPFDRVDCLRAWEAQASWVAAREQGALVAVAGPVAPRSSVVADPVREEADEATGDDLTRVDPHAADRTSPAGPASRKPLTSSRPSSAPSSRRPW